MVREDNGARDTAVKAALKAWRSRRPKDASKETVASLWEAAWAALDFSWEGLADAGWERGDDANEAQMLKRWQAPADFPGGGKVHGEGETAWKEATLQDYWRWSLDVGGHAEQEQDAHVLLDDAALKSAGLLVERSDGRLSHVLHCPDTAADAASDEALANLLTARLAAAEGWSSDYGPDGRVRLPGARAIGIDGTWRAFGARAAEVGRQVIQIHVDATFAALGAVNASGLKFGKGARFVEATFGDDAQFERAIFGDGADFACATFGDGAGFREATFGDLARFDGAAFGDLARFDGAAFGDLARFRGATFGNSAWFREATFGDRAGFDVATFGDLAWFSRATFGDLAWFEDATFGAGAAFTDATFGDWAGFERATFGAGANFWDATFGGDAKFERATFRGSAVLAGRGLAEFMNATFGDRARFEGATFDCLAGFMDATFGRDAKFERAIFGGDAKFERATFGGDAKFERATFGVGAAFTDATFGDWARFGGATFGGSAKFERATFGGSAVLAGVRFNGAAMFDRAIFIGVANFGVLETERTVKRTVFAGPMRFRDAVFAENADFSEVEFPGDAAHYHAAFEGARFRELANFKIRDFVAFAAFDGAAFERLHLLELPVTEANEQFRRALENAEQSARTDKEQTEDKDYDPERDDQRYERGRDARFGALEGGLRAIKLAKRQQGDDLREQRFYRYELRTRRKRPSPSTPIWEKIVSYLYGWISDYGNSIVRPFVWLAVLSAFFAGVYWIWAFAGGAGALSLAENMENARSAFEFSLHNVFRPFDVWSADFATSSRTWLAGFKGSISGFEWIAVRIIAAIQSFSTLLLVFLFALAVRRRFKIA